MSLFDRLSEGTAQNRSHGSAYNERLQKGPVSQADVAGHKHLLQSAKAVLHALDQFNYPNSDIESELNSLVEPLRRYLALVALPAALVAKPKQTKMKFLKRGGAS